MGQNIENQSLNSIIRQVAYLPQNPNDLLFSESVLDELKVTLANHGLDMSQEEMLQHLQDLTLDRLANAYPRISQLVKDSGSPWPPSQSTIHPSSCWMSQPAVWITAINSAWSSCSNPGNTRKKPSLW